MRLLIAKEVKVGDFVNVQAEAFVTGPQPQDRQLLIALAIPTQPHGMELGAVLGIAREEYNGGTRATLNNARSSIEQRRGRPYSKVLW